MNWKVVIIGACALFAVGLLTTFIVKSQTNFDIEHKLEVPQTTSSDGRYQAGETEHYIVWASPALVWSLTGETAGALRLVAVIIVCLIALYLGICASGAWQYNEKYFFAGLILAAACWFGAFSSAFAAGNKKRLTPAEYEAVKDSLKSLFTEEAMIR